MFNAFKKSCYLGCQNCMLHKNWARHWYLFRFTSLYELNALTDTILLACSQRKPKTYKESDTLKFLFVYPHSRSIREISYRNIMHVAKWWYDKQRMNYMQHHNLNKTLRRRILITWIAGLKGAISNTQYTFSNSSNLHFL